MTEQTDFDQLAQEITSTDQGDSEESQDESKSGASSWQMHDVVAGDAPDDVLEPLVAITTLAEQNYQEVLGHIKTLKESQAVLRKFHARKGDITPMDVQEAKKKFNQAKESYVKSGDQIKEGIKSVYNLAKKYPLDLVAQNLYITYLAKLLISMETRNPMEPYVKRQADWHFVFQRPKVALTSQEKSRGMTEEDKMKELLDESEKHVNRLEARYEKRGLSARQKAGEKPTTTIKHLRRLTRKDPGDLHTMLWLSSMLSAEYAKTGNQNKRLSIRDDILDYCKRAFSTIDDFLNMQGIENLSDRDKKRTEYVKTITAIRKPLMNSP